MHVEPGTSIPIANTECVPFLTSYAEESIHDQSSVQSGTHLYVGGNLLPGNGREGSLSQKSKDNPLMRTAETANPAVQIVGETDESDREGDAKGRKRKKQSGLEKLMQREKKITFGYDTSSCTNLG